MANDILVSLRDEYSRARRLSSANGVFLLRTCSRNLQEDLEVI
jgi:hypothetical protein